MQRAAPFTDQQRTICKRAHAGLIKARAAKLILPSGNHSDADIGEDFWWAEGGAALEQNWVAGDFSTWINQKFQVKVFGACFWADDIYAIVPGAPKLAGRWIDSVDAVELVAAKGGVPATDALAAIVHCCANQLVAARCQSLSWQYSDRYDTLVNEQVDDDVIPTWFWRTSAQHPDAVLNWRAGNFAGPGVTDQEDYCQAQAKGIAFDRETLTDAIELAVRSKPITNSVRAVVSELPKVEVNDKRPLSESDLQKWWTKRVAIWESLTQDELLAVIRVAYPDKHISRERIRALTGERKRGPKP